MDWITGMQKAIDYIEDHLTETIDYEAVAAQSFSSSYHFQRVFSILCGFTLGEYIRNRRLSLAGAELASGKLKVIDAALKYGYESPDSFAKAFQKFHGITPSQARAGGSLQSFSRLSIQCSLKGGFMMDYRIEKKPAMILTGYKRYFTGVPYGKEREEQEKQLFISTRAKQWLLSGASVDPTAYCVIDNITEDGYDYYYSHQLDQWTRDHLYDESVTGADFMGSMGFENVTIPEQTYAIFKTKDVKNPICDYFDLLNLRIQVLTEWMPDYGFRLAKAPELAVYRWNPREERCVEIWLPIEKTT